MTLCIVCFRFSCSISPLVKEMEISPSKFEDKRLEGGHVEVGKTTSREKNEW